MHAPDAKDLRILYELERDARASCSDLAKKVALSKHAVLYRISALEKSGAIQEYLLVTNTARFGYQNFEVWLRLRNVSQKEMGEIISHLKKHPNVYTLTSCTLSYDLNIGYMARNAIEFRRFFSEFMDVYGKNVNSYDISVIEELFNFGRIYLCGKNGEGRPGRATYPFSAYDLEKEARLSDLDLRILDAMRHKAREKYVSLSKTLRISEKTLRTRIRKMKNAGTITGFKAHIHPEKIGYSCFEIFVAIKKGQAREAELLKYCANHPNISYYIRCIAKWDLDIAVEAKNVEEFQQTVSEMRDRFSDIIISYDTVAITCHHKFNHVPPLLPVAGPRNHREPRTSRTSA